MAEVLNMYRHHTTGPRHHVNCVVGMKHRVSKVNLHQKRDVSCRRSSHDDVGLWCLYISHTAADMVGTTVDGSRASHLWVIIAGSTPTGLAGTRADQTYPIEPRGIKFLFHSRLVVEGSTYLISVRFGLGVPFTFSTGISKA